ncbi:MAG: hypothetical protein PHY30_02315 [Candidatus Pacebacteria bacterium]|nr:hypothetical protein [Candidatus Paceibacterota bacterium]
MKFKLLVFLTIFLLSISSMNVFAKGVCALSDKLDEVKCGREIYLQDNISSIAKEKGINTSSKFYINSIDWINNDSALVEFEDGGKKYLALIDFNDNNVEYVQIFEPGMRSSVIISQEIASHQEQAFIRGVYEKIKGWFSGVMA